MGDQRQSIKLLAIFMLVVGSVVESLRLPNVVVPLYKLYGESAVLQCPFDLERDRLYAVKWYKDNEEFFRYVPKYTPPMYEHRVDGVHVKLSGSDAKQVTLHKLDMKSTGVYRCEVSAERPSFASVQGEGRMTVVHLPAEGPQISGTLFEEYEVGDTLDLNCTSAPSFPPARLSWYINDALISTSHVKTLIPPKNQPLSAITSVSKSMSQLTMQLEPEHLEGGSAKVRCVASIFANVWQDGDEKIVNRDKTTGINDVLRSSSNLPLVDDRETLVYVRGGSTSVSSNLLFSILSTLLSIQYHWLLDASR